MIDKNCKYCTGLCIDFDAYSTFTIDENKYICPCIECIIKCNCTVECPEYTKFDKIRIEFESKLKYLNV